MITRAVVKQVLLAVEKRNGFICFLDMAPANITREELRVLIEAAKHNQYHPQSHRYDSTSDAEFLIGL